MWIVKGILLGVVIFIVAGISYILIRVGITKYRLAQAGSHYYQISFHVRWLIHLIHQPIVWAVLLLSVAIGIWIVRARPTHNRAGSVDSTAQN
jgi:hypothetical protein